MVRPHCCGSVCQLFRHAYGRPVVRCPADYRVPAPLKSGVHPWPDRYGGPRWWTAVPAGGPARSVSTAGSIAAAPVSRRSSVRPIGLGVELIDIRSDERQKFVSTAIAM